jgi:DNA-directed RNA polymerase subunit RPC12/RpoP
MSSRGEIKAESKADKERAILNSVMTRGRVSVADLAIEGNLTRDQVRDFIYDLIGKDLFRGYVNWDRGELVSAEAAEIKEGSCPNCGGRLELAGKGLVRCPYCGTEIYLSRDTSSEVAAGARPGMPPISTPPPVSEPPPGAPESAAPVAEAEAEPGKGTSPGAPPPV